MAWLLFNVPFQGAESMYMFLSQLNNKNYRLHAGIDIENQRDNRQRFNNLEGNKGALSFDQKENFFNAGIFLIQELELTAALKANLGTRFDVIRLKASDFFLTDGDDSGTITLNNFSPMFGLIYSFNKGLNIYANLGSNFETPTLNELSNNPSGEGGFNPKLQQQKATSLELGIKGLIQSKWRYEVALFNIDVQNEIVPYELELFPGRSFYRNAGSSNRKGLEATITYPITSGLTAALSYTYADFVYKKYTVNSNTFDGNVLPGSTQAFDYRIVALFTSIRSNLLAYALV